MQTKKEITNLDIAAGIVGYVFYWFMIPVALLSIWQALVLTL